MKSYVIHLIRNMPCEGNLEGRYIGRTESPLAMGSIAQLAQLKRQHPYPPASRFFASPSTRCVDTLKILYPEADPQVVLELAECDFGEWENKTAKELQGDPRFCQWMEGGGQTAPPGGESSPVFVQRVCSGFEMLVKNLMAHSQNEPRQATVTALLCTHAGVMTALLAAYGLPRAPFYDWMCEPGHGYSVRITPSLWMRSGVMEVFATLPGGAGPEGPGHLVIDLAREAAQRAYGDREEPEKNLDKQGTAPYNK